MYKIVFSDDARKGLILLQKKEHRIVYRINEDVVEVLVLSVFGHYS